MAYQRAFEPTKMCRTIGFISLNWPKYCDEERDALLEVGVVRRRLAQPLRDPRLVPARLGEHTSVLGPARQHAVEGHHGLRVMQRPQVHRQGARQ